MPAESQFGDYSLDELFVAIDHDLNVGGLFAPGYIFRSSNQFTACRVLYHVGAWDSLPYALVRSEVDLVGCVGIFQVSGEDVG